MLPSGEHIILDIDHLVLFLKFITDLKANGGFWDDHRKIAKAHAEEFIQKNISLEELLKRLDACNLFKMHKNSRYNYTLVTRSDIINNFVKIMLEEILSEMGYKIVIKEDFAKLRLIIIE